MGTNKTSWAVKKGSRPVPSPPLIILQASIAEQQQAKTGRPAGVAHDWPAARLAGIPQAVGQPQAHTPLSRPLRCH
jgi:hypothetical protein